MSEKQSIKFQIPVPWARTAASAEATGRFSVIMATVVILAVVALIAVVTIWS